VFADDFFFGIAFGALGAAIPAGDVPLWVEHEDGVILHAFHEQFEWHFHHAL
jgi:hypothetical protein